MQNSAATEAEQSLPLHRVLEDEYMNLYGPLPEGYPWSFIHAHINDPLALIEQIFTGRSKLLNDLREQLPKSIKAQSPDDWKMLEYCDLSDPEKAREHQEALRNSRALRIALINLLNSKLEDDPSRFFEQAQVDEAKRLATQYLPHNNQSLVNRLLLESAFPQWLKSKGLKDQKDESEDVSERLMESAIAVDESDPEKERRDDCQERPGFSGAGSISEDRPD